MFVRERLDEEREGVEVRTAWSSSSRSATLSTLSRCVSLLFLLLFWGSYLRVPVSAKALVLVIQGCLLTVPVEDLSVSWLYI